MKRADGWLLALLLVSVLANALLGFQLIQMRNREVGHPAPEILKEGATLTDLSLFDSAGQRLTLRFTGSQKPIILYAFSTTCRWCIANSPKVEALEALTRGRYEVLGLCVDDNAPGCKTRLGRIPVTSPTVDARAVLKLGPVPQTIVVSASGLIERVWTGTYEGPNLAAIESFFGKPLDLANCYGDPCGAARSGLRDSLGGSAANSGLRDEGKAEFP